MDDGVPTFGDPYWPMRNKRPPRSGISSLEGEFLPAVEKIHTMAGNTRTTAMDHRFRKALVHIPSLPLIRTA